MDAEKLYCPSCGGMDTMEAAEWFAKATDDPDNTAFIYEWQCNTCHGQSFWVPEEQPCGASR